MDKPEVHVGMQLYAVPSGINSRIYQPEYVEVTKIGRKYLYLCSGNGNSYKYEKYKFCKRSWSCIDRSGDHCRNGFSLFSSKEEYTEKNELDRWRQLLPRTLRGNGRLNINSITLEQYREIGKILMISLEDDSE